MDENISPDEKKIEDRKAAKQWAVAWTIIYIILLPFFFYVALLSAMVFDNDRMPTWLGLWFMFMVSWLPLSMAASIYLMWSNYSRTRYRKTLFYGLLPFFIFAIIFILQTGLEKIFL